MEQRHLHLISDNNLELCTHPLCLIELVDLCDVLEIMVHFDEVRVEGDGQIEKLLCIGQFLALTLVLGVLHLELLQ